MNCISVYVLLLLLLLLTVLNQVYITSPSAKSDIFPLSFRLNLPQSQWLTKQTNAGEIALNDGEH